MLRIRSLCGLESRVQTKAIGRMGSFLRDLSGRGGIWRADAQASTICSKINCWDGICPT